MWFHISDYTTLSFGVNNLPNFRIVFGEEKRVPAILCVVFGFDCYEFRFLLDL